MAYKEESNMTIPESDSGWEGTWRPRQQRKVKSPARTFEHLSFNNNMHKLKITHP